MRELKSRQDSMEVHCVLPLILRLFLILFFLIPLVYGDVYAGDNGIGSSEQEKFSRIISLYSAHTENLVSMGAEEQLIGISVSDTFPEHILDKPRFSYREDPERFIAARPDLILIRPMIERFYPQLLTKLRQAGIKVVSLQPNSVEEIYDYWRQLGRLCGRPQQAEKMIQGFVAGLDKTALRVSKIPETQRPHVYFESIHSKVKTFARKSIAIFVLEQAGGINIAKDAMQVRTTNIAAYSKERILARAEEIDIYLAQRGRMNPVSKEMIMKEPGFLAIKAVRNGHVYLVDEELVSRPTLRILEGVQKLTQIFYPELLALKHGKEGYGQD